jgi:predicted outer membrane repeat protein
MHLSIIPAQVVEYSAFRNNHAQDHGGAIYVTGADSVLISRSVFDGCVTSAGAGGSMAFTRVRNVTILRSNVTNGIASKLDGGGINIGKSCSTVIVKAVNFYNNSASGGGGALWIANDAGQRVITGCRGNRNSAFGDGCTLEWVTARPSADLHQVGCLTGWRKNVDDRWRYVSITSNQTECVLSKLPPGASIGNCPANRMLAHGDSCELACTDGSAPVPIDQDEHNSSTASCANGVLTWNSTCSSKACAHASIEQSKPCQHGGVCGVFANIDPFSETSNKQLCSCPDGWRGDDCTLLDMCTNPVVGSSLCKHDGTCKSMDNANGFSCQCAGTGFVPSGTHLTEHPSIGLDCNAPICLNGGAFQPAQGRPCRVKGPGAICKEYGPLTNGTNGTIIISGGLVCHCAKGWWSDEGGRCAFRDPCTEHNGLNAQGVHLSFNHGSCHADHSTDTSTFNFNCSCLDQYGGDRCEEFYWDETLKNAAIASTVIALLLAIPLILQFNNGLADLNAAQSTGWQLQRSDDEEQCKVGPLGVAWASMSGFDLFFDVSLCVTLGTYQCGQPWLFGCAVTSVTLTSVTSLYLTLCMVWKLRGGDTNELELVDVDARNTMTPEEMQGKALGELVAYARRLNIPERDVTDALAAPITNPTQFVLDGLRLDSRREAVRQTVENHLNVLERQTTLDRWISTKRRLANFIIIASIIRIETLTLLRLKLRGSWVIQAPIKPKHYHFIRYRAGWFRYVMDDIPHLFINVALLLLARGNDNERCEAGHHWFGLSAQTIAIGGLTFSAISMVHGFIDRVVNGRYRCKPLQTNSVPHDAPRRRSNAPNAASTNHQRMTAPLLGAQKDLSDLSAGLPGGSE